jgi:hypothetical protein
MRSMRRLVVVRLQGSAGRRFGTLERQIDISNQNLKAAAAAFEQAEWIVAQARAGLFPILDLKCERAEFANRRWLERQHRRRPIRVYQQHVQYFHAGELGAGPLGKIRRTFEADVVNAQVSAGDLASARLSAQGALASD